MLQTIPGRRPKEFLHRYPSTLRLAALAAIEAGRRLLLHGSPPPATTELNVRLLFGTVFALAIAAAVGLGATWMALTRGSAYGGVNIGAWLGWPKNGPLGIAPYAPPRGCATGELPGGSRSRV